tara:strand:+ start:43 stop:198 length:156 start_codon:yes stop_codon:yes gene_type:complete
MLAFLTFIVGFISGMYVATQYEKSIDRNIERNSKKETYVDFVEKHYKKKDD